MRESCQTDCAGVAVNDVGFIAKRSDGQIGFSVYVGGGMGAHSRVGELLEQFVPADQIHLIAEAIKRVFDQHGNRRNRSKARLRFLIEKIGLAGFRQLYEQQLKRLEAERPGPLPVRAAEPHRPQAAEAPQVEPAEGFELWRKRNAQPQAEPGYLMVELPLPLGNITAEQLEGLAELLPRFGDGLLRTTQQQNAAIRWVQERELPALHRELLRLGLANSDPPVLRNLTACAGSATCRLGICRSGGLAQALYRRLQASGMDLERLGELRIQISGCPNACGRHPIADIALAGAARRVKTRLVPFYVVSLGGRVGERRTRLASGRLALPARAVPQFLIELLAEFQGSELCPDFHAFLEAGGRELAERIAVGYRQVPDFEDDKNYYYDWGADEPFSLAGRGPGECGAGVFELIGIDLASAAEALQQGRLYEATVLAARALLVTRGQQGRDELDVLQLFRTHFIEAKLVQRSYLGLIDEAIGVARGERPAESFQADRQQVAAFVQRIRQLYDSLGASLRFEPVSEPEAEQEVEGEAGAESAEAADQVPAEAAAQGPAEEPAAPAADREADLRGLACPLNYVRTKMILEQMQPGQTLAVLLDAEGARNVPESTAKDGHEVLAVRQEGSHWRLIIRRK